MRAEADITREMIETFLYREAVLLDSWQLQPWLELFTPDGAYLVPSLDLPDAGPEEALYLIDDDHLRLTSRVKQLLDHFAFAENPRSRTRHSVSNILFDVAADGSIHVRANFIVNRFRQELHDIYVGRYEHVLVRTDGGLKFR